jgi:MFS family permease
MATVEASPPTSPRPAPPGEASSLSPFRHPTFTVLWVATIVSNIGTWMQNAAAGWLMTGLDPDPFIVSLVQVATSLPMFLFALAGGALADIVDRRRLLIGIQTTVAALVAGFGLLVWLGQVTPIMLLAFSFLAGTAAALIAPAWMSIVPQLVPRENLQPAVALNGVGLNVSRAIGPALAGLIIVSWGLAAPFWLNAFSTLGVIAALVWWQRPADDGAHRLPAERFGRAIRAGLRHARHNPHLRATLIRAAGFFIFASAYWALLPLVARDQVAGGPRLYGLLLGAIGVGAVTGALTLPFAQRRFGPDAPAWAGTVGTAIAMVLYGLARQPSTALAASFVAGVSWIAVCQPSTFRRRSDCRAGCAAAGSRSSAPSCSAD